MNNLPEERLTQELEKVLVQADEPSRFFRTLDDIGALKTTFPELYDLKDVPAGPEPHHQGASALEHTLMVLDEMSELRPNDELALLMSISHDLGKGATPQEDLPHHYDHESRGVDVVENMTERLSMSNEQEGAMKSAARLHMRFHNFGDLRASTVVEMVDNHDIETLFRLIDLAIADSRGREPSSDPDAGPMVARLFAAGAAIDWWTGERLIDEGYDPQEMGGENFGNLLHQKRVEMMREIERRDS